MNAAVDIQQTPAAAPSDFELLQEYLRHNSEAAFTSLVERHLGLVRAVALRHCHDSRVAEEVANNVFLTLIKKASRIRSDGVLAGWLFNTARYLAANARGFEQRRRQWTHEAAENFEASATSDDFAGAEAWQNVCDQVDAVVAELNDADRAAVVMRFYQNHSYREIANASKTTEEAARKRVDRAIERLRDQLRSKGIDHPAATLIMILAPATHPVSAKDIAAVVASIRTAARIPRVVIPFIAATLIATGVALAFILHSPSPTARDAFYLQTRAVIEGDGDKYVETLHFENPEEQSAARELAESVRVRFRLRQALETRFGSDAFATGRFPALLDLFDTNRIANVTIARQGINAILVTPWGSRIPFVSENGEWKLDFFRLPGMPPPRQYIPVLGARNKVFGDAAADVANDVYASESQAFADISNRSHRSR